MAVLNFDDVVGLSTVEDGGYAGKLLALSLAHLDKARDDNTLTDSQVGEVYASVISSSIQEALAYAMQVKKEEINIEILQIQKETAAVEKLITDEKYITIQEQNGKISYKYIYKYYYIDYANVLHLINPNKTDVNGKIIQGYVDENGNDSNSVITYEVFDQYKDGDGSWIEVNTVNEYKTIGITIKYYSIILSDGSRVDTNVSAYKYNKLANKECYVFSNNIGEYICVTVDGNELGSSDNLSTDMEALKTINGIPRTATEWLYLYNNGDAVILNAYKRVLFTNSYNVYNRIGLTVSRSGWDGIGTAPEYGMLNSKKEMEYTVNIDKSNVYSKTISDEVNDGDDSMVQLEKKKLLNDIVLANKQLGLSKIPSTLR